MLKQDRHYLNSVAEELASLDNSAPQPIRNDGPRVQDGTSYFHGVWADGGVVKSSAS